MTSEGGTHARFKRTLATGNLLLIRAAAAELPQAPPLDDALKICLVLRDAEAPAYRAGAGALARPVLSRAAQRDVGRGS